VNVEISEVLQQGVQIMFENMSGDGSMSAATGGIMKDGSLRVAMLTLVVATMEPVGASE
jgi:hypothetical protein